MADATMTAELRAWLGEQLTDPGASWSVGTFGAIAEFAREPDEPCARPDLAISTPRGAVALHPGAPVRPVAFERASGEDGWSHAVALCLPADAARMHARQVVTELGEDTDSLRQEDASQILFDLGLGVSHLDVCVRTGNPETLRWLRAAEGRPLLEPGSALAGRIAELSPHRVFLSKAARAEVYTPIPPPDGVSPDGPHTHILPRLLAANRTHPATEPIPAGWVPAAHLYPAHPIMAPNGTRIPFDAARHQSFQQALQRYGSPDYLRAKAEIITAVRAGTDVAAVSDVDAVTVRVALRQLARTDGDSPTLRSWLTAYPGNRQQGCVPLSHPDGH